MTTSKQRPARNRFLCLFPVAGVPHSLSPLASLIMFLSTLVVHGDARVFHETQARVASSLKGQYSLDVGRGFSGRVPHCRYRHSAGFRCGCILWSGWEEESERIVAKWAMDGCRWSDSGTLGRSVSLRGEDERSISW